MSVGSIRLRSTVLLLALAVAIGASAGTLQADDRRPEGDSDHPAVVERLRGLPAPTLVEFPWRPGRFHHFKIGAEEESGRARRGALAARLYRAPQPGPAPYAVLMSGCGGSYEGANGLWLELWARTLRDIGVGALALDSFDVRGVPDGVCGDGANVWAQRRVDDAHAALAWLAAQNFADPKRIFVMGMSNGARAALLSVITRESWRFHRFAAAVGLYPMCDRMPPHGLLAPVLLLVGQADKQASATECGTYAAARRQPGSPSGVVSYPQASHLFDVYPRDDDYNRFEVTDSRVQVTNFLGALARSSAPGDDLGEPSPLRH